MKSITASSKGLRKLNCNPQRSHFCVGKLGRGSCIPNSKACRYVLKKGIETTIAEGTVGKGNTTEPPKPVAPPVEPPKAIVPPAPPIAPPEPKPPVEEPIVPPAPKKTIVSIPENSVISNDPKITPKGIAEALQVLADADPEYADRFDRFGQFLATQGTVSVFLDSRETNTRKLNKQLVENAEALVATGKGNHVYVSQVLNVLKSSPTDPRGKRIKALRRLLGSQRGVLGYTFSGGKHVVVESDTKDTKSMVENIPTLQKRAAKTIENMKMKETGTISIRYFGLDGNVAQKTDPPYGVNDSAVSLATYLHEMGHQVHYTVNMPSPPKNAQKVSRYAGENHKEFFAEAFTLYMISPREYKAADPVGFQFVDDTLKQAAKSRSR